MNTFQAMEALGQLQGFLCLSSRPSVFNVFKHDWTGLRSPGARDLYNCMTRPEQLEFLDHVVKGHYSQSFVILANIST